MNVKQLIYLLVPTIALSTPMASNPKGESDDNGTSFTFSADETRTSPGGFLAVAEPAGPVDAEAAKRAAEEYARKCIVPQVEVLMTMGMTPGPPEECAAQVNTGAPYPNYTVSHPWETQ